MSLGVLLNFQLPVNHHKTEKRGVRPCISQLSTQVTKYDSKLWLPQSNFQNNWRQFPTVSLHSLYSQNKLGQKKKTLLWMNIIWLLILLPPMSYVVLSDFCFNFKAVFVDRFWTAKLVRISPSYRDNLRGLPIKILHICVWIKSYYHYYFYNYYNNCYNSTHITLLIIMLEVYHFVTPLRFINSRFL